MRILCWWQVISLKAPLLLKSLFSFSGPGIFGDMLLTPCSDAEALVHGATPGSWGHSYSIVPLTCQPFAVSVIYSGKTESRGKEEGGGVGSIGSDEANNWGMDDSIDVNAVRSQEEQTTHPHPRQV